MHNNNTINVVTKFLDVMILTIYFESPKITQLITKFLKAESATEQF